MDNKKWLALFSQTGKEIADVSRSLNNRYPDFVITDNMNKESCVDTYVLNNCPIEWVNFKTFTKEEKILYYEKHFSQYDLITLHGWLNIIPGVICERYEIYNGHPGLITHYPELKGKDPQVRAWNDIEKYPYVGSVVHRVTPVVDDGEILTESVLNRSYCTSLDETYNTLRATSLRSWVEFLRTQL